MIGCEGKVDTTTVTNTDRGYHGPWGGIFFYTLFSTTSSVVFIAARIASIFVSSTAVDIYDFHIFTAIIQLNLLSFS